MFDSFIKRFFGSGGDSRMQGDPDGQPNLPSRPAAGPAEQTALRDAERWLDAATLAHGVAFGLGEERFFEGDQGAGELKLVFEDDAELNLSIQILGSFRPQDGSFRWSWANSSIDRAMTSAVTTARDHPSVKEFTSFTTPTFTASFYESQQLVALAARLAGRAGVYRCITDRSLSMFVGYALPVLDRQAWFGSTAPTPQQEADAIALINRWDEEMYPLDVAYEEGQVAGSPTLMDELLAAKMAVYRRYWRREDSDWEPCSFGWPSEHDPADRRRRFCLQRRAGGLYVVTQTSSISINAHVVEMIDGAMHITDIDLDWGDGLLLASPASA
jgi:hypothetical protein